MFTVSRALPVNPPGETRLTRADVWRGLEMKANNALPFVSSVGASKPCSPLPVLSARARASSCGRMGGSDGIRCG